MLIILLTLVDSLTFTILLSAYVGYALGSICCGLQGSWKRSCSDSTGQGVCVLASRLLKSPRQAEQYKQEFVFKLENKVEDITGVRCFHEYEDRHDFSALERRKVK